MRMQVGSGWGCWGRNMASADIAIIAFIVFTIMLWRSLMRRAREEAKAMDEWHLNRKPYRWQDEIMRDDVPVFVKLASSWLLVSVATPATGWGIFLAMYKSGWVERRGLCPRVMPVCVREMRNAV